MHTRLICAICGEETGPQDDKSMIDGVGIYCGACMVKMGLDDNLILPCGLCRFPILGSSHIVNDPSHDCEYCETCYGILIRMGF